MSMKKSNRTWRRPPVEWDKHEKMRSAILKRKAVDEEDGKRARARWEQRKREKHDNQAREVQQDKLTAEERQAEIKVLTDKLEELHDMKHNYFISLKRILKGEEAQKLAERQQLEELQAKEAQLQQQQQQQEQQQAKPSASAAEPEEALPSAQIPIQPTPQLIPPVNAAGNVSPPAQMGGGHMHSLPYMPMLNVQAGGMAGGARMVMDAQASYSMMHAGQIPMTAQQYIQSGRPVQHPHPMNMAQHAQLGAPIGYGHHPQVITGPHGGLSYMAQQPRLIALSHPVPGQQQQMQAPGLMAQQQGFRGGNPAAYAAGSRGMPHMRFK